MSVQRKILATQCLCAVVALVIAPAFLRADTISVDSRASIFLAGQAASPDLFYGVLPVEIPFLPGTGLTVRFTSVTGEVSCCGFLPGTIVGPDGGTNNTDGMIPITGRRGTDIDSTAEGIAGILDLGKSMFLVGLFLTDDPASPPAPARLDFTGNENFTELSPALRQAFFIGDGLTGAGTGSIQQFHVPAGATRLYLGFADGLEFQGPYGYYHDNAGRLEVRLEGVQVVPEPSSPLLIGGGLAVFGFFRRFGRR